MVKAEFEELAAGMITHALSAHARSQADALDQPASHAHGVEIHGSDRKKRIRAPGMIAATGGLQPEGRSDQ